MAEYSYIGVGPYKKFRREVNMFDFDGVVREGATPDKYDIIITGRTIEEAPIVYKELIKREIFVPVYFNPIHLKDRQNHNLYARTKSGKHKANTIQLLKDNKVNIGRFHEDDPVQISIIKEAHPEIEVVEYPFNEANNKDT